MVKMLFACIYYQNLNKNKKINNNIINYNEIGCKIIAEIVKFLIKYYQF